VFFLQNRRHSPLSLRRASRFQKAKKKSAECALARSVSATFGEFKKISKNLPSFDPSTKWRKKKQFSRTSQNSSSQQIIHKLSAARVRRLESSERERERGSESPPPHRARAKRETESEGKTQVSKKKVGTRKESKRRPNDAPGAKKKKKTWASLSPPARCRRRRLLSRRWRRMR
jgi:hypothetical protein